MSLSGGLSANVVACVPVWKNKMAFLNIITNSKIDRKKLYKWKYFKYKQKDSNKGVMNDWIVEIVV